MGTYYLSGSANRALEEVQETFKRNMGIDIDNSQTILYLYRVWKVGPVEALTYDIEAKKAKP
jgi:hypothetical protein